ncbi:hypothetical protein NPIL_51601 [Nephila pilipes]|uniref:Uncharacterized protein n=1 Tax=Nephila pilipes TaxID=299642 RepID=A0A8X6PWX2_NEPPI|nr:hypothetical protein NPIL_51601 [Nephila pilipes]
MQSNPEDQKFLPLSVKHIFYCFVMISKNLLDPSPLTTNLSQNFTSMLKPSTGVQPLLQHFISPLSIHSFSNSLLLDLNFLQLNPPPFNFDTASVDNSNDSPTLFPPKYKS